ncbi:rcc1 and btb domain-containing protein [Anaeramoeba flamelloides]|uniref:Rcc1 and btb domain-containing protein n=1 Tax=Anaeramoeba flamelloides TaxID=1746091 RepID=A0AAV7Y4T3_9EUKA|nr:rcc1 and btb domain-containing protein [Anaeramoeba flamelloides]
MENLNNDNKNKNTPKANCFYIGSKNFFFHDQKFMSYQLQPITNLTNIEQICGGSSDLFLLNQKKEMFKFEPRSDIHKYLPEYKVEVDLKNDGIVQIDHSYYNGLFLTYSGRVYFIGTNNSSLNIPLEKVDDLKPNKAYLVEHFTKKNIFIKKILCTSINNYFITSDNDLYGNGYNSNGQLGNGSLTNLQLPIKMFGNVSDVYGSTRANHVHFTTFNNELRGTGYNSSGQLGIGHEKETNTCTVAENISGNDIKTMSLPWEASIILFKDGKILSTGKAKINGRDSKSNKFLPIPQLKDVRCINIESSENFTILLTIENEMYGLNIENRPVQKITSSILPKNIKYELSSTLNTVFLYPETGHSSNNSDFLILLESGKFSDYTLKNFNIKIHKSLVECRLNKTPIEEIETVLNEYNDDKLKIQSFFKWVYSGFIEDYAFTKEVCDKLQIDDFCTRSFEDDLLLLYNDEDTKNFNLLVKVDDEDEEDEDEDLEEIPVHKYILYARSGLFREMFNQIEENANSVTDYSSKTIESLEILIKYFYTSKIELTADHDPQLIVEELNDALEYYQLNENCNLSFLLSLLLKK